MDDGRVWKQFGDASIKNCHLSFRLRELHRTQAQWTDERTEQQQKIYEVIVTLINEWLAWNGRSRYIIARTNSTSPGGGSRKESNCTYSLTPRWPCNHRLYRQIAQKKFSHHAQSTICLVFRIRRLIRIEFLLCSSLQTSHTRTHWTLIRWLEIFCRLYSLSLSLPLFWSLNSKFSPRHTFRATRNYIEKRKEKKA